ncbi:uncharacterized protein N7515_008873 [Penicillium bovifimosum]|uniref:Zn(2)-C6 fungal-type domain-containing protein n=1 Tax=Penicillium bovifimosum TaxID=126998 RepID=A0A9W9KY86_9EURO|nr:uncharacterized protein N7515_008873 [Penicillium bovifimosum]KAJ5125048.1 hypothetical protein N7515_008873 [Penicillium bovifimosum]
MSESTSKRAPRSNDQLQPNQKMRTTCNACQQAKIRCSHSHPCERCESHGYQCIYSISQPLGRPAKKKTARLASSVQTRKREGEAVDRWARRNARRGATRPSPPAREQRVRKVWDRMPSPSTTFIGADPIGREVLHRSDSGTGTRILPVDENSQWPSIEDLISDIPEDHISGDGNNNQEPVSKYESKTCVDSSSLDIDPHWSFEQMDGCECTGCSTLPEPSSNHSTQCLAPQVGLMVDETHTGDRRPFHAAVPGTQGTSLFRGGAIYPYSLSPDAMQISGTVQDPARIMDLPSTEIWQEVLEADLFHFLRPENTDLYELPGQSSAIHCNCYSQAFSEALRCEESKDPHEILIHLERVQQRGLVTLQCPSCYGANARADILTLLIMGIEKAARALKSRTTMAITSVQGGIYAVWGAEGLSQLRRCLSHLSIIVRFIYHDLERATPSTWRLVMADETDRRLQSIIRLFE